MSQDQAQLRQSEYQLRLVAQRLRRDLNASPDPDTLISRLGELEEAEKTLAAMQQEADAAGAAQPKAAALPEAPAQPSGLLVDTKQETALLGPDTTGLDVEMYLRMQHVPTGIYHLLDKYQNPLISCKIRNTGNTEIKRVRVIAFIDGYSAQAVETVELKPKKVHEFVLLPTLFPERINQLNELTRATLNIRIEDLDGRDELQTTEAIWLLSRNTAPLSIKDPATGEWKDMTRYFGAFVTPNHPLIQSFLHQVAAHHPKGVLEGYHRAAEDPKAADVQVQAIFEALKQAARITYVDSIITNNPDEGTSSQRVRLPRQSLRERQANCIDGTVLFASLIEAISMNPAIVVVPGHVLLAWEKRPASGEWGYLETTKVASHSFEDACKFGQTWADGYQKLRDERNDERYFKRWPLNELRAQQRITPME